MPHHAPVAAWTEHGYRRWLARCDMCGAWRIVGWYYECYPPRDEPERGWWYACADCLLDAVDEMRVREAAKAQVVMRHALDELRGERMDGCWSDTVGELVRATDASH